MQLIISSIILLIIDFTYLSLTSSKVLNMVKQIQQSTPVVRPEGALASYILLIMGLNTFILNEKKDPMKAALLGFIIYGVFDAVNYALFKKYTLSAALQDALWGGILFYTTTYLTYLF